MAAAHGEESHGATRGGTGCRARAPATNPNEEAVKTRTLCLTACAILLSLSVAPLRAAEGESHTTTPQREKFAACVHQAQGLKGDERREFMSECLRKHPEAARDAVAAESGGRLAPCNAEADRLKLHGDERRAFLGACLRG